MLRSEAMVRVLAAIVLAPESLHLRALADRTGLSASVVQREVERLEKAGWLTSQRFATSRVVRANDSHPLYPEVRSLLLKTYGPRELLEPLLREEPGIERAYLHGSWAARYHGDWGGPPGDVDVVAVGEVSAERLDELEAAGHDLLGVPVQIEAVATEEWAHPSAPFVKTVRRRPIVPLWEPDS